MEYENFSWKKSQNKGRNNHGRERKDIIEQNYSGYNIIFFIYNKDPFGGHDGKRGLDKSRIRYEHDKLLWLRHIE